MDSRLAVVSALHLGGADTTAARRADFRQWGAEVRFTGCADGDMAEASGAEVPGSEVPGSEVPARRRAVVALPWTWLRQVHGARVVRVELPGQGAGAEADAAVTTESGVALAVLTADCAPIALASPEGVIGVAHAGWRGLLAGVVEETVTVMRQLGATRVVAARGPCIHAECYEFGADDLDLVAARLGDGVRGRSRGGETALDLPAAVDAALRQCDAELVATVDSCTACSSEYWSWRARQDRHRQASVVWRA